MSGHIELWLMGVAFGFMFGTGVYIIGYAYNVIYKIFK